MSRKALSFVFARDAAPCLQKTEADVVALAGLGAGSAFTIFLAYLMAQALGGGVVALVAGLSARLSGFDLRDPVVSSALERTLMAPAAIVGMLLAGAVLLQLIRYYERPAADSALPADLGWSGAPWPELRLACATGALVGVAYLWLVSEALPPPPGGRLGPFGQMASTPGFSFVAWIVLVLFLAPPLEEVLFRGVLLRGLSRSWGLPAASVLVTGLFVLVHLPETGTYWPALVAIGLVGAGALVVRIRSRSLAPAIALHGTYNLVIVLGVILPRGG